MIRSVPSDSGAENIVYLTCGRLFLEFLAVQANAAYELSLLKPTTQTSPASSLQPPAWNVEIETFDDIVSALVLKLQSGFHTISNSSPSHDGIRD